MKHKKSKITLMLLIAVALVAATTVENANPTYSLEEAVIPVPIYGQQTNMWCWAASSQMVLAYMGDTVQQCEEANWHLNRKDCCDPNEIKNGSPCAKGGSPTFQHYGYDYSLLRSCEGLPWDTIVNLGNTNSAWAYAWAHVNTSQPKDTLCNQPVSGGHVMVGRGYKQLVVTTGATIDTLKYVVINNPMPVNEGTYAYYLYEYYGSFPYGTKPNVHAADYYNIYKAPNN